jgi:uncharacterized delta-60 repeat protein
LSRASAVVLGGLGSQIDDDPMVLRYHLQPEVDSVPTPQVSVTAVAAPNDSIKITWTGPAVADLYEIDRNDGVSGFSPISTVGGGQNSYTDVGLTSNHTYQYKVMPITSTTAGAMISGPASQAVAATSFTTSGASFVEATSVPLTLGIGEDPVTSSDLSDGTRYVVIVSGTVALGSDYNALTDTGQYYADGAYWYVGDAPNINGSTLGFDSTTGLPLAFGLALSGYSGVSVPTVPNWGAFNVGPHTYAFVVTGDGGPLTLQFECNGAIASGFSSNSLDVRIYKLSSGTSSSSDPIRTITSPVSDNGLPPVISTPTPVSIVSAAPDGTTSAPWKLWLVSATGTDVLLASGGSSVGSLPFAGAAVVTLDPSRFTNGIYSLELTDDSGDLSDPKASERIDIEGLVKLGDLVHSTTDVTISSAGSTLSGTRVYDSDQSGTAGMFGYGWSFNLLDSQLKTTHSSEGYDPTQFASKVMRDGDTIDLFTPVETWPGAPDYGPFEQAFQLSLDPSTHEADWVFAGWNYGLAWPPEDPTLKLVAATASVTDAESESPIHLSFDATLNEYLYTNTDGHTVAFNPANPDCELVFVLHETYTGDNFLINPATGQIENLTAANTPYMPYSAGYNTLGPTFNSGLKYFTSGFGAAGDATGSGQVYDSSTMRVGDLISLVVPNSGSDTFEFDPTLLDPNIAGGASVTSYVYQANFISLNGSGDSLKVIADPSTQEAGVGGEHSIGVPPYVDFSLVRNSLELVYDRTDNEFLALNNASKFVGFDPSDPILGLAYQLSTASGYIYIINATTGRIESCSTADGTAVYSVTAGGQIVDGSGKTLLSIQWSGLPAISQITSIQAPGQSAVTYQYDGGGRLAAVTDQLANTTSYSYQGSTGLLNGITNSLGVNVLAAAYAPVEGYQTDAQLLTVTDRNGISVPIDYSLSDGGVGIRTATGAGGSIVEMVYDQYGNVIRTISPITSTSGALTGYVVAVGSFTYGLDQVSVPSPGVGNIAVLRTVDSYSAFQISAPDSGHLRYSQQPLPSTLMQETAYVTNGEFLGQVESRTRQLGFPDAAGQMTLQKITNSNFVVTNAAKNVIEPAMVVTEIDIPDSTSGSGFDDHIQSVAAFQYDTGNGNLIYSIAALLEDDSSYPGNLLAEGTKYSYTNGQVSSTRKITADVAAVINTDGTVSGTGELSNISEIADGLTGSGQSQNDYYDSSQTFAGALIGRLMDSIDASGHRTVYFYNDAGEPVLTYSYEIVAGIGGLWIGTTNIYDDQGRLTDTYQATYHDVAIGGPTLNTLGAGNNSVVVDTTLNTVYSAPIRTSHTDYNDLGEVVDSIDQLGGETSYLYDANGRTIQTFNPDGTTIVTIYDDKGRAVWTTSPFVATGDSGSVVTANTIYNDLGQVTETDQYTGTSVTISGASGGMTVSQATQIYNSKGQLVETFDSSGLYTGTLYYPNGQVAYSGILRGDLASDWYENSDLATGPNPGDYLSSYTTNKIVQYDSSSNLLYAETVDPNANAPGGSGVGTKSYQDGEGQSIRAVFPDGSDPADSSYSETLYSFGNNAIPQPADWEADIYGTWQPTSAEGWNWDSSKIPSGGREVVQIAQRKSTDPMRATFYLYDAAGRLTDVWQPAVIDANPASSTYGLGDESTPYHNVAVRPHTTYLYDSAGNEIAQITAGEQGIASYEWTSTDTSLEDRPVAYQWWLAQVAADPSYATSHPFTNDTRWTFDSQSRQTSYSLPDGEIEYSIYDDRSAPTLASMTGVTLSSSTGLGELAYSTDFDGHVTQYFYDNRSTHQGQLVTRNYFNSISGITIDETTSAAAITTAIGSTTPMQVTSYTYDALSRQETVTVDSETTTYYYDDLGNVKEEDSPEGVIHYIYDTQTGLHTETWTATSHESIHDSAITDTLYGYDTQGRLKSVSSAKINGQAPTTGAGPTHPYSAVGVEDTETNLPTTIYDYDLNGNKIEEDLPNGEVTNYQYDVLNRLTSVATTLGMASVFSQTYVLNDDGTRASSSETEVQPDGATTSIDTTWDYDADQRLVREAVTSGVTLPGGATPPPDGLNTWFDISADSPYNEITAPGPAGDIQLVWDGSEYTTPAALGTDPADLESSYQAAQLLTPTAGADFGGNGTTEWVLLVLNNYTGMVDSWSFTLSDGVFTPDGVVASASSTTPITVGSISADYTDTYSFDLENNRMAKGHIGPGGGPSESIQYWYNGDDEQIKQQSSLSNYTYSYYDANGSLIEQDADSTSQYQLHPDGTFGSGGIAPLPNFWAPGTAYATGYFFAPGSSRTVVLPDGDILVAGSHVVLDGTIYVVKYKPDGSLDATFGTGGVVSYYNLISLSDLLVLPDGSIVLSGSEYTSSFSSPPTVTLMKLDADGSLHTTFGSGGYLETSILATPGGADNMALTPDGNIVVSVAACNSSYTGTYGAITEYTTSGTLVTSFGTTGTDGIATRTGDSWSRLTVLPDGDILVADASTLAEYDADGHLVSSFGTGGVVSLAVSGASSLTGMNLSVLSDGSILVSQSYFVGTKFVLRKFTSGGAIDTGFGTVGVVAISVTGQYWTVGAVRLLGNGDILVAATLYDSSAFQTVLQVVEFKPDGSLDSTFGTDGIVQMPLAQFTGVSGMTLDADGSILFTAQMGNGDWPDTILAKYAISGTPDGYSGSTQSTIYTYDLRNKLVEIDSGTTAETVTPKATFVYDDAGNRVQETAGGVTMYYLTDDANPTGYAQPIEAKSSPTVMPVMTYVLGDRVEGQADSSGNVSYLLADGHGSTKMMTNAIGTITATFDYDAFGTALNFNAGAASTVFLFGGDAVYDPTSGLYLHGNGVRATLGFIFIQRDSSAGSSSDPIALHKYLYADANPISNADLSGYYSEGDVSGDDESSSGLEGYLNSVFNAISVHEAATANLAETIGSGQLGAEFGAALLAATAGVSRPSSAKFWSGYKDVNYETITPADNIEVWKKVGGSVAKSFHQRPDGRVADSCATRMCWGLNYGGDPVQKGVPGTRSWLNDPKVSFQGVKGDNNYYIIGANEMLKYFNATLGPPDTKVDFKYDQDAVDKWCKNNLQPGQCAIFASRGHTGVLKQGYTDTYATQEGELSIWKLGIP